MRWRTGTLCAVLAIGAALVLVLPALGSTARVAKASQGVTTKITYIETNHGHLKGSSTVGIQGHGSFSAKLTKHAALEAAVLAAATGIPFTKIAQGGTYTVEQSDLGSGVAVVSFTARGLGTLCISFSSKRGKFVPAGGFFARTGTLKMLGGTGPPAKWAGSASFKQTNLTGIKTEQFTFVGSAQGSVGKAKKMSATCRRVARLPKH
jgi:hypothetical protein